MEIHPELTYKVFLTTKEMRIIGLALAGKLAISSKGKNSDRKDALELNAKLLKLQIDPVQQVLKNLLAASEEADTLLAAEGKA